MSFRSLWHFGRVKFCALTSGACLAVASATHGYAWNLEEAAKPYQGEQIRVICDGYSPCLAYQNMASSFTEITGIEVQFEIADLQSVQQKILANALTEGKAYDLVQVISWQVGVWAAQDFARPMTEFLENDELRDPNLDPNSWVQENIDQVARYNGELYGMPMQFVVPFGVFRRDIAANSSERKAFEARYGYEMPLDGRALLSEMESWNQWYDLNEFFTRDAGELLAGDTLEQSFYGTIGAFKRHPTIVYDFERVLLGFGGSMLSNDGRPQFDSPAAKKALEYLLSMRQFSPPGYKEFTWDNQYSDFCAGNTFTTLTWSDTTPWLELSEECPNVAGKIGYFVHPGTHLTTAEGQSWMVPASAQNPESAYLFAQYLASKSVQEECAPLGCATFHKDVINQPTWDNDGRMLILRKLIENNWLYVRPNLPGLISLQDIVMEEISAVAAGQQSVEQTLSELQTRSIEVLLGDN